MAQMRLSVPWLSNPGFVLKPDFDRPVGKLPRDCGALPGRRSFFKSFLCVKVALRVQGTHRHAAEIQLLQQLADAALMQMTRGMLDYAEGLKGGAKIEKARQELRDGKGVTVTSEYFEKMNRRVAKARTGKA